MKDYAPQFNKGYTNPINIIELGYTTTMGILLSGLFYILLYQAFA